MVCLIKCITKRRTRGRNSSDSSVSSHFSPISCTYSILFARGNVLYLIVFWSFPLFAYNWQASWWNNEIDAGGHLKFQRETITIRHSHPIHPAIHLQVLSGVPGPFHFIQPSFPWVLCSSHHRLFVRSFSCPQDQWTVSSSVLATHCIPFHYPSVTSTITRPYSNPQWMDQWWDEFNIIRWLPHLQ